MAQGGLLNLLGLDPRFNRDKRERLMLQELQNKGQMDVEGLRGKNDVTNTRTRGEEDRKTNASTGEISKALEVLRSANLITEAEHRQKLSIMEKEGVVSNKENDKTFDKALTDTRIRKALQSDTQMVNARQAPGFQESLIAGEQAKNLMPAFANMQAGKMNAGQGDLVVAPPSGAALPPADLNQWNQMQGGGTKQTIETPMLMYPGMKEPIPGQPKVTSENVPGRVRVNPQLLQQAAGISGIPGGTAPQEDPVMQMLKRFRMIQGAGAMSQ